MRQYNAIKSKYPDAILLFRIGDFYETFGEDAVKAADVLGIILTKRANGAASEIELAGFPHHALDKHLPKLVRAGYRVAICDQLEDPKQAKGVVKRGITEIVTPGITLSDALLDHEHYNYLACVCRFKQNYWGAAFLEVSTGDFFCLSGEQEAVEKIVFSIKPSEIVVARPDYRAVSEWLGEDAYIQRLDEWAFEPDYARKQLLELFGVASLKGFGIEEDLAGATAAGVLAHYLKANQQTRLNHITRVYAFPELTYVSLDKFTIRNLEIVAPLQEDGGCLFDVLNYALTPMGARLLKKRLLFPLLAEDQINARLDKASAFAERPEAAAEIAALLKGVGDPERLLAKLATLRINPRELTALQKAMRIAEAAFDYCGEVFPETFQDLLLNRRPSEEPRSLLDYYLEPECPANLAAGGVIKAGVSDELDEIRGLRNDSKQALDAIKQREIKRTGISSLKVSYNKVFGYYIEITNAHKDKAPPDYIRKQTLTNAERYITEELKEFEDKILSAEERMQSLEAALYSELLAKLQLHIEPMQTNAQILAELDVSRGLAQAATERQYARPEFLTEDEFEIIEGRHPVIEALLPPDRPYIPNDIYFDRETSRILVITGPNMAGKSAVLRQTALIALMAQAGSYVPARSARLMPVDKIFTRVGASDNLAQGESTFMVEMNETARIMNNATPRSLVILDEIGRGTSTYDGVAIAWAIVEYLHNQETRSAKTLFATHYHELAEIAGELPAVKNLNVSVEEIDGKIIFLRKLKPGASAHSFGINVAEMAGMPPEIVTRAKELLAYFERQKGLDAPAAKALPVSAAEQPIQLKLFAMDDAFSIEIKKQLDALDPETLAPVEALMKIVELKKLLE